MKRGATKQEIIRTTQTLIIRNGIRAVRVDEIAQTLGISKRTLYETFTDKTTLIYSCLEDLSNRRRRKVLSYIRLHTHTPLQKIFWLINEYIESLRSANQNFLSDLQQNIAYAEYCEKNRRFWEDSLHAELACCMAEGYILYDTGHNKIAGYLIDAAFKLRFANASNNDQRLFCRTILRGIATHKGIEWIDTQC